MKSATALSKDLVVPDEERGEGGELGPRERKGFPSRRRRDGGISEEDLGPGCSARQRNAAHDGDARHGPGQAQQEGPRKEPSDHHRYL